MLLAPCRRGEPAPQPAAAQDEADRALDDICGIIYTFRRLLDLFAFLTIGSWRAIAPVAGHHACACSKTVVRSAAASWWHKPESHRIIKPAPAPLGRGPCCAGRTLRRGHALVMLAKASMVALAVIALFLFWRGAPPPPLLCCVHRTWPADLYWPLSQSCSRSLDQYERCLLTDWIPLPCCSTPRSGATRRGRHTWQRLAATQHSLRRSGRACKRPSLSWAGHKKKKLLLLPPQQRNTHLHARPSSHLRKRSGRTAPDPGSFWLLFPAALPF